MGGPPWAAAALAALMIATAIYCAGRLIAARLWRRSTEVDADAVHVAMGVAMAGMLLPQLSPLPSTAWEAVFATAAAWFTYRAVRSLRQGGTASRWRCSHPVPHLVESAAMVFMLTALPGSWPGLPGQAMAMPAAGGGRPAPDGSLWALAVILALFMIGYVLWTADQLTALVRAPAAVTSGPVRDQASSRADASGPVGAAGTKAVPAAIGVRPGRSRQRGTLALAPRLAACYKIAMGIAMGYMLFLML
jgi:hypothetical protein